jgi:hypothetical protein
LLKFDVHFWRFFTISPPIAQYLRLTNRLKVSERNRQYSKKKSVSSMLDLSNFSGVLTSLWQLVLGTLTLNPEAYEAAIQQQGGTALAIIILLLGGISMGLGQSVVLFAN